MIIFPAYVYFLAASFLICTLAVLSGKYPERHLRLFSPFLGATLAAEITGNLLDMRGKTNLWVYNYFTTFEFCFYLFVICLMIQSRQMKKVIYWGIGIYAIVALANIIFVVPQLEFHTVTYSLGCLLVVAAAVYYFLELFRKPKNVKLQHSPEFWICSGLLFFYCSSFPLYSLLNFWADISPLIIDNFGYIISILNVFLYLLFAIAFLCRTKNRKYIS
jgi:hypothetical protein